jgi:phosphatidylglycerophosphate synthase
MSKLPKANSFIDLSDYGRPFAVLIARSLKNTKFTPIHITFWFIISGLLGIVFIVKEYYWATAFFLILKSILDAADGELARIKETPSYTGRFFDSISDIILNFLILFSVWYVTKSSIILTFLAFISIQLQGTLYNYYYVILRNRFDGDATSRVFENEIPTALKGESQKNVTIMFKIYQILYGYFDKVIYFLDDTAPQGKSFPQWFMTSVSIFGLGFHLLIINIFLILGLKEYIIPLFILLSIMIFVFISIRKLFLH